MNDYSNKMYSIININYLNNFVYKNINDKEKKYIKTLFEIVVTICEKVIFSISETFSDPVISVSSQEKKNVTRAN